MIEQLNKCNICPQGCNINRNDGQIGRCKSSNKIKIALYNTHYFEEPCISGENGSGTVFFSNCNLNCIFCQNYEISQMGKGREITIEELAMEKVNNYISDMKKIGITFEDSVKYLQELGGK